MKLAVDLDLGGPEASWIARMHFTRKRGARFPRCATVIPPLHIALSLRCSFFSVEEVLGELRIVRSISSRGLRRDCRIVLKRRLEKLGECALGRGVVELR